MAITYIGQNATPAGVDTAASTLTLTTTRTIEAGEHVVVIAGCGGGGATAASVSVGSLSLALDLTSIVDIAIDVWSARATAQIASGATITITWGSPPTNRMGICFSLGGVVASGYEDQSAGAGFGNPTTITNPSISTPGATAQDDEIAIGVIGHRQNLTSAPDAPHTEIAEVNLPGGAITNLAASYHILTTAGVKTAAWTISGTDYGDVMIITYKAAVEKQSYYASRRRSVSS